MKQKNFNIKNFTPEMKKLTNIIRSYDEEFDMLADILLYYNHISYKKIIPLESLGRNDSISDYINWLSTAKDAYILEYDCVILMSEKSIIDLLTKIAKRSETEYKEREEEEKEYDIANAIRTLESNKYQIIYPDEVENSTKKKPVKSK